MGRSAKQRPASWRQPAELDSEMEKYRARLEAMTPEQLGGEAELKICLSAYANNNARSDYHWQVDATYAECKRRDRIDIYEAAYERAVASAA